MVDYSELDKYYIGISRPILTNVGGLFFELGDENHSLFYKIDENLFVDVNRGALAQIKKENESFVGQYVLSEESLTKVETKKDITNNSSYIKRLKFNPSKYTQK